VITVSDGTNTTTYTVPAGPPAPTVGNLRTAINGGTAAVTATYDSSGHLVFTSANYADTVTAGGSAAAAIGFGGGNNSFVPTNLLTQSAVSQGQTMVVSTSNGTTTTTQTITFGNTGSQVYTLAGLQTALQALTNVTATINTANGNISMTAQSGDSIDISASTASTSTFGLHTQSAIPSNQVVVANDISAFLKESIGGGAITAFDISGSPVNIQLRWAKIDSATLGAGHSDTWNLFYQAKSNATGTQTAWQNVGTNFTFGANGQMNPLVSNITLNNVTINGSSLGTVQVVFGSGGLTQFSDPNGTVQVNQLQQNGFPAGSLQSVSVDDKGDVVGSYSNGRAIPLAQVTLANFNGADYLKRIDGGAFEVTDESGPAIIGAPGKIVSSSLEGSNTDIADEFTKLIVTQQAYSANTRVITTSNQMVQDLLSMLR
jgi:flagellar hook protein FlgE